MKVAAFQRAVFAAVAARLVVPPALLQAAADLDGHRALARRAGLAEEFEAALEADRRRARETVQSPPRTRSGAARPPAAVWGEVLAAAAARG